jgi:hypothetical protein
MKIFYTILFSLLILSTTLFSQENNTSKLANFTFGTELGIVAGTPIAPAEKGSTFTVGPEANEATMTVGNAKGQPGIGVHGAIFARYHFNKKIGIQSGLAYNAKKAAYKTPAYDQDYTYLFVIGPPEEQLTAEIATYFNGEVEGNFNNQYIEVPLLFLYSWNDKWTIQAGGYAAMLIKGSHKVWATGIVGDNFDTVENKFQDESESINKWDYGLSAGINYNIFRQFEAELRMSTGLRSIFSDDYLLAEDTVRNLYIELKANYTFKL